MGFTEKVREFTKACYEDLPNTPKKLSKQETEFISNMVNDELEELKLSVNATDQADAFVDIIYYIINEAIKHGINLDPLFDIVHKANMKKVVNGKVIRRGDGKIMKPVGWEPPNLYIELRRQQDEGSFSN